MFLFNWTARKISCSSSLISRLLTVLPLIFVMSCDSEMIAPLKVASHEWPGYEPLHLARDLGYYNEKLIQLYEVASATSTIRAFRNGNIEVAALTLDEVLLLLQDKIPIKIIMVMDVSKGADAIVAHPPISSLKELKGKRIGVESMALGAYMLSRALDFAELDKESINPVYIPFNKHESAFLNHEIDALVTFEPAKGKLILKGANLLLDSSQLPNEIVDVLVIHEQALRQKPQAVKALIRGWFDTLDYIQNHKQDAAERVARRIDSTPDDFLASLETIELANRSTNLELLTGYPPQLEHTCQRLAQLMLNRSLLTQSLPVKNLFIPDVQRYLSP